MRVSSWAGLPLAILLAGCFGNEPSESDILQAVRQSPAQRQFLMLSHPGVNFNNRASIESAAARALQNAKVEKLGCSPPQGVPGLMCEFRIGLDLGNGQLRYEKVLQRFLKVNGNWQIPN